MNTMKFVQSNVHRFGYSEGYMVRNTPLQPFDHNLAAATNKDVAA